MTAWDQNVVRRLEAANSLLLEECSRLRERVRRLEVGWVVSQDVLLDRDGEAARVDAEGNVTAGYL